MRPWSFVVALLVAVLASPAAHASAAGATPVPSADAEFLALVNGSRRAVGLHELRTDAELARIAYDWAVTMADRNDLEHNPALQRQVSRPWLALFENVGNGAYPRQIFDAFLASPSHREIIVDRSFTLIGIGTVRDASGLMWTSHVFMQPAGGSAPAPPQAAAPTTTRPAWPMLPKRSTPTAQAPAPAPGPAPSGTTPPAGIPAAGPTSGVTEPPATTALPAAEVPDPPTAEAATTAAADVTAGPTRVAASRLVAPQAASAGSQRPALLLVPLAGLALAGLVALRRARRARASQHW